MRGCRWLKVDWLVLVLVAMVRREGRKRMAEATRADEDAFRFLQALCRVDDRPEGILRAIRETQENAEGVRHVWEGLANIFTDTLRVTFIFCQKSE